MTMRESANLPGMKVLESAFDSQKPSKYLPDPYTANAVCYKDTHVNMTMQHMYIILSAGSAGSGHGGEKEFSVTMSDSNWTWRVKDDIITKKLSQNSGGSPLLWQTGKSKRS